jgi:lysophospholipase L1-like esterase
LVIDTITPIKPQVVVHDVNGKKALFIGDSHTAADYGWQYQVAKKTGMAMLNTAVGGKQTPWMLEIAKQNIHPGFDYCFIYGGANDMASNRQPMKAVKNIQAIVDLCLKKQVKPIVITGFDPLTCVVVGNRTALRGYPQRYARFQQLLVDSIKGATVLKTHCISRTDCGDYLCHMTALGHRKMGEKVISSLAFKKI